MRIPSNKIKDIKRFALNELSENFSQREIKSMITQLIYHFTGIDNIKQSIESESTILESDLLKLSFAIKDLKNNKPLQYIIGYNEFYGLRIGLKENVLIPRPETEELVGIIIKENSTKEDLIREGLSICDIGSGSGAIGLALKKHLNNSCVLGLDISISSIIQGRENAKTLDLDVEFLEFDILNNDKLIEKYEARLFDIIVSNPPYIMESEKELIRENVLNYEPHQALFVPNSNPLLFYKSIYCFSKNHLRSGGKIYLEINENLAQETSDIFKGHNPVILKDIFGKHRFIIISF